MNPFVAFAVICLATVASACNPNNVLIGCGAQDNLTFVCVPVPSNARVCHFPLECARLFLQMQPVDALLWQPLFRVEGNATICSEMNHFRAELSGATLVSPKNDTLFHANDWFPCESYKSCMYSYLDLIDQYPGVLFRELSPSL